VLEYIAMTSVEKELYEFFADDCRRAAEQADDPEHRLLLLKPRSLARGSSRNQQGRPSPKSASSVGLLVVLSSIVASRAGFVSSSPKHRPAR
jgi:hypothetical protein